ncbi:hypothetical protein GHT06_018856 [Daphnia sinensis]|uniref:Ionotropic glutamate receptor C-terminal domain-containing protein n=1 Tax=Daphnia sinensis TaxID=1820382 RepID=A0AAD5KPI0_9CRUS|nr:hypothetical protein GHT06_018856 [Daphnia sinensis]
MNKLTALFVMFLLLLTFSINKIVSGTRQQLRNNLNGKVLRVVTGHFPPVISVLRNSSGHIIGYGDKLYHHLLYLSEKLHFTFVIFPAAENTNGIKQNGTWNGVIGALTRDEADLGLVPVAISLDRHEAIEFSGRVGGDYTGILVKYPHGSVSFTSAFDVFSPGVWIGWVVSAVVVVVISTFLTYVTRRSHLNEESGTGPGTFAWYLYSVMISQGSYFPSRQPSQKLLAATWCFVSFVFVNIYNSTLTSYMSVTYQKPEVNSFYDLAAATSYKATILTGSIQEIDLMESNNWAMKIVADRIEKCSSDCKKFSVQELVLPLLDNKDYVSILPVRIGSSLMQKYNSERVKCRLALAYEKTSWLPMFFAVQKNSPYHEEINRE